jgi:3'-phosphoadenosine 5'-phosphosulfate sulfotransferase (PAPS reductase)/FAD synthetase
MAKRKKKVYIASCSFGKDSIATILLALENREPLHKVVFAEVMYDKENGISAEYPEHIKWVYEVAIPKLREMGIKVDVVKDEFDYLYYFYKKTQRGKRVGKHYGYPMAGKCKINILKLRPIREYLKQFEGKEVIQYIGIAKDETRRLQRLDGTHISLLDKYGYTEAMAIEKCKEYGLLSPVYEYIKRSGCWFCPNNTIKEFAEFKRRHTELWDSLVKLRDTPNLCSTGFKYKTTIKEIEEQINIINNEYQTLL